MEGNMRIERLPLGPGTDHETDISLASGSGNIFSTCPYHDPVLEYQTINSRILKKLSHLS
jgi:hypothetical protein